jgi:hypothetical protein
VAFLVVGVVVWRLFVGFEHNTIVVPGLEWLLVLVITLIPVSYGLAEYRDIRTGHSSLPMSIFQNTALMRGWPALVAVIGIYALTIIIVVNFHSAIELTVNGIKVILGWFAESVLL